MTSAQVIRLGHTHLDKRRSRGQTAPWDKHPNRAVAQMTRKRARVPPRQGSSGQANTDRLAGQIATSSRHAPGIVATSTTAIARHSAIQMQSCLVYLETIKPAEYLDIPMKTFVAGGRITAMRMEAGAARSIKEAPSIPKRAMP